MTKVAHDVVVNHFAVIGMFRGQMSINQYMKFIRPVENLKIITYFERISAFPGPCQSNRSYRSMFLGMLRS